MIAALALLVGQAAVPAQEPATVVVTGRRADHDKAVRHMTATIAPLGDASEALPRFDAPICPDVAGLPADVAARFAGRMRQVAGEAGLQVGSAGCAPNITVVFVDNGQTVVRALRRTRPEMFGNLEPDQVRRLAADPGPVHAWSFTEVRSRDNDRPRGGTTTGLAAPELQVRGASITELPTRTVVDGAVMLIDQQAAIGKTITQLADHATMRVLAQTRPTRGVGAEPTILTLFGGDPQAMVPGMTDFDLAYLKAFYRGQPTARPQSKVLTMARQINRDLARAVAVKGKEQRAG